MKPQSRKHESVYCPYIRFKQKPAEQLEEAWLFDGEMHNGAHYPLAVFTHNASRRSPARWNARHEKSTNEKKARPKSLHRHTVVTDRETNGKHGRGGIRTPVGTTASGVGTIGGKQLGFRREKKKLEQS